jgi:hypothetical protein
MKGEVDAEPLKCQILHSWAPGSFCTTGVTIVSYPESDLCYPMPSSEDSMDSDYENDVEDAPQNEIIEV